MGNSALSLVLEGARGAFDHLPPTHPDGRSIAAGARPARAGSAWARETRARFETDDDDDQFE